MKKKMNNNGFSLVELIIVVAIMAILIGILAPQYIKYVEKSRISSDAATAQEFVSAMQVLASDDAVTLTGSYSVSATSGAISVDGNLQTLLEDNNIMTTADMTNKKFKSKLFRDTAISITLAPGTDDIYHVTENIPEIGSTK